MAQKLKKDNEWKEGGRKRNGRGSGWGMEKKEWK